MNSVSASLKRRTDYRAHLEGAGKTARELDYCQTHPVHWFNHHILTYDPRLSPAVRSFDLFPKQAELVEWLLEREAKGENGLIVKSRDSGITFLCAGLALHQWLFRPGCSIGFGSRKLELIDRLGDLDSIFEKIRFMLYSLPSWMLPEGFDRGAHDNLARLLNPANESSITGEGGDNIGRGGRKTMYFVDEAAFLEQPESIDRALSQTTRCRIDVSTPNGPGNPFAQKRFGGKIPVFSFHWKDDPRKGDAWYAEQKKTLDPVTLAQEVDMDFNASIEGICIPGAWVRAAVEFDLGGWAGYTMLPTVAGLDIAEEGPSQCAFVSRRGPMIDAIACWNGDTTETAWRAAERATAVGARIVCYDGDGIGAGVRAAWKHSPRPLPFRVRAVHGGAAASENRWPDGKTGREKFVNLRAELWWLVRRRFERTHAWTTRGEKSPPEDCISIPNDSQLIAELSLPLREFTETGKTKIESKKHMKERGVRSPDRADALCYSFAADLLDGPSGFAAGGQPFEIEAPRARQESGFAAG